MAISATQEAERVMRAGFALACADGESVTERQAEAWMRKEQVARAIYGAARVDAITDRLIAEAAAHGERTGLCLWCGALDHAQAAF